MAEQDNVRVRGDEVAQEFVPTLHVSRSLRDARRFDHYVRGGGHREIEGWINEGALTAFALLASYQQALRVSGGVCEIGVHHGRSFLVCALLRRPGERAIAIDVFENQYLNTDQSGKGDRASFARNIEAWVGKDPDVTIMTADSQGLHPRDVLGASKEALRLFSIDGSHTCAHTLSDLMLAEGSIGGGGLVVVDDFLNPHWPGVMEAIVVYLQAPGRPSKLVPLGYGDSKFWFSSPERSQSYAYYMDRFMPLLSKKYKRVDLCGFGIRTWSLPGPSELLDAKVLPERLTVDFGLGGNVEPYLSIGWHKPEKGGRWSNGALAGITFKISEPVTAAIRVILQVTPFVNKSHPTTRIKLFANGEAQGSTVFDSRQPQEIEIDIQNERLASDGRVEIFMIGDKVSPSELGVSMDTRDLSLFVARMRWVRLERDVAPEPARSV